MFDSIAEKLQAEQKAQLDELLFNWLEREGYSFPRTLDGITNFLTERGMELQSNMQEIDAGYIHTFKLVKIISTSKVLVKTSKIIIES